MNEFELAQSLVEPNPWEHLTPGDLIFFRLAPALAELLRRNHDRNWQAGVILERVTRAKILPDGGKSTTIVVLSDGTRRTLTYGLFDIQDEAPDV